MKAWRVQLEDGKEIVVQLASVLDPDDDEEFDEALVYEIRKLGFNPDLIDDYWPNE